MNITLRTDIINFLIKKNNYNKYLEIGVQDQARNFNNINCKTKIGVDPNGSTTFKLTSDTFFEQNEETFDIVLIDGLHLEDQVDKDIQNSLKFLNKNGTVVLHDCLPISESHQREVYGGGGIWAGTVWRSIAKLRMTDSSLEINVVDIDWGCGILRKKSKNTLFKKSIIDYSFYEKNKNELMNVITVEQFKQWYGK